MRHGNDDHQKDPEEACEEARLFAVLESWWNTCISPTWGLIAMARESLGSARPGTRVKRLYTCRTGRILKFETKHCSSQNLRPVYQSGPRVTWEGEPSRPRLNRSTDHGLAKTRRRDSSNGSVEESAGTPFRLHGLLHVSGIRSGMPRLSV